MVTTKHQLSLIIFGGKKKIFQYLQVPLSTFSLGLFSWMSYDPHPPHPRFTLFCQINQVNNEPEGKTERVLAKSFLIRMGLASG